MKRIVLFIVTNLAVIAVLSISLRLLGFEGLLNSQGVNLNLNSLLLFAAIFGFGGAFISLAISKWSAKRMTGAAVIKQPQNTTEEWLLSTVRRQALGVGIDMPDVAIYDSPEVNAFATGMNKNKALVAVSSGLLHHMTADEVEAVLAHEVSHVANGDMVTLTLIQGIVNTFVIFLSRVVGHIVDRVILKNERGHGVGYFITTIIAEVVLGMLASIIVMWFSRQREFRADDGGAKLAGREKMVAALHRLQQGQASSQLPDQIATFGISGGIGGGLKKLFMSHPPLAERIARLEADRL